MKINCKLAAASAALLMVSAALPTCEANAGSPSEAAPAQVNITVSGGDPLPGDSASVSSGDFSSSSDSGANQEPPSAKPEEDGMTAPAQSPLFGAHIEFCPQGYVAMGTFTEFLPGTVLVRPMYSLDGECWQNCQTTWNLQWLGSETAAEQTALQNQKCLFAAHEPLAGYLAGQLDRFYLKLQITLENGITYETQAAVIDRGGVQQVPDEYSLYADFVPAIRVRRWRPFKSQGQCQITVSANATSKDISALLPDTLPIGVQLLAGTDFIADAAVDCPVTWKPLSLSGLTPGESVIIEDAAEEIIVPAGTLLNTPVGIFLLKEPLQVEHDEVRLILNVAAENAEPTGTLHSYFAGLEIAFDLKPTGAAAIRAYTLSEGESAWTEVPEPLLPETVNAPSSTAGSLFTFLLTEDQEPYHSWLTAWNAGEEPVPFLVGLKIEGGVYDGQQLILAFPDTYEIPLQPPKLDGAGGNECNAGSDNKDDSTAEGQRPNLPQNPADNDPDAQNPPQGTDSGPGSDSNVQDSAQGTISGQDSDPNVQDSTQNTDSGQNSNSNTQDSAQGTDSGLGSDSNVQDSTQGTDSSQGSDSTARDTTKTFGDEPKAPPQEQSPDLGNKPGGQTAKLSPSPGTNTETGTPIYGANSDKTVHTLQKLLLCIAAAAVVLICFAMVLYKKTWIAKHAQKRPDET